jgi:hypothetical protein
MLCGPAEGEVLAVDQYERRFGSSSTFTPCRNVVKYVRQEGSTV